MHAYNKHFSLDATHSMVEGVEATTPNNKAKGELWDAKGQSCDSQSLFSTKHNKTVDLA